MTLGFSVGPVSTSFADVQVGKPIISRTPLHNLSHKKKYGFQRVKGFTRRGSVAQRFEIRHGDCGRNSGYNDCSNDRQRVERSEKPYNRIEKPNGTTWYGYSIFIPREYRGLGKTGTTYGQVKTLSDYHPIWFTANYGNQMMVIFFDGSKCKIGSLSSWTGRWVDVMIKANYAKSGTGPFFEFYKDGKRVCSRSKPLVTGKLTSQRLQLYFRYGIYNSFVSRWLSQNATRNVTAQGYSQTFSRGSTSKSAAANPFKYDWGVQLPTQVVFYDEMRYGKTREEVDVRLHEKLGIKPVD